MAAQFDDFAAQVQCDELTYDYIPTAQDLADAMEEITMNRAVMAHAMGSEIKVGTNLDSGIYADYYSVPILWTKARIFESQDKSSLFIFSDYTKVVVVCRMMPDGYYQEAFVMTYAEWVNPMA